MIFLGRDIAEQRDYSERTAEEIDQEVRRLVDEAQDRCRQVLAEHRDKLDELAAKLVEVETLDGDELARLLGPAEGRHMPDDEPAPLPPSAPPSAAGSEDEADEEQPQGRPGLAWGQSSAAPPPAD